MGYAFDTGIMEIPYEEALAIAIMNARIRDSMLNPQEQWAKDNVKKPQYVYLLWSDVDDPYSDPILYGVYVNSEVAKKDFQDNFHAQHGKYLDDEIFNRITKFELVLVKG